MKLVSEKGALSWLTVLPLEKFGFKLHKSVFHDALSLRHGWQLLQAPSLCACCACFSIKHSLSCPEREFSSLRHNKICSITASLLTEVTNDVGVEPYPQPFDDKTLNHVTFDCDDNAQIDMVVSRFWE